MNEQLDNLAFWLTMLFLLATIAIVAVSFSIYNLTRREGLKKTAQTEHTTVLQNADAILTITVEPSPAMLRAAQHIAEKMEENRHAETSEVQR